MEKFPDRRMNLMALKLARIFPDIL